MSSLLEAVIANTRWQLPTATEQYSSGDLLKPDHPHAMATLFRRLGVSRMFMEGVVEPLFLAQMQAAGAYVYGLRTLRDDDKVTSRAAAFWDAIGGEYWDAAAEIAHQSRMTHNPTWEHEDDFLYVAFLMNRYFFVPDANDEARRAAHAGEQQAMLNRWEEVLDGGDDPRLELCRALLRQDGTAFWSALLATAEARDADVQLKIASRTIAEEDAAWYAPFWGEGLALLRLAARDGLVFGDGCPMVPTIARAKNGLAFDDRAWMRPDLLA